MYCIENEFDDCIAAIKSQTYQQFEYFVIQNLPNKTAHDTLYAAFMKRAGEFDLFIKIDADMVLCRNDFFEQVVKRFEQNTEMDLLEIQVQDFFTNRFIGSLNVFRNTVTFNINDEKVFVDRIHNAKHRVEDKTDLAPAAWHCPNPSNFQAFHFGLHKAVKIMQFGKTDKKYMPSCEHWENYETLKLNYKNNPDIRLAYAILGAEIAFRKKFTNTEIDFNNQFVHALFDKYSVYNIERLNNEIKKINIHSFSFLPSKLRQDVLYRIQSTKLLSFKNLAVYGYIFKMIYYHTKMKLTGNK